MRTAGIHATAWRAIDSAAADLGLTLRAPAVGDIGPLFRVHDEALGAWSKVGAELDEAGRERRFQRWIAGHDVRVLERHGELIGIVGIERSGPDVYFTAFELAREWRGRGIATHIFQAVMDVAGCSGAAVTLHVYAENPARRLFDRLGFRPIEDGSPFGSLMVWTGRTDRPPERSDGR